MRTTPLTQHFKLGSSALLALGLAASIQQIRATPYASELLNSGGTVSFRLNESADSVSIIYTNLGGSFVTNTVGALPAGPYSNALGVPGTFSVRVEKNSGPGYLSGAALQISSDATNTLQFNSPRGVAVNANPASAYFGRIYVANSAAGSTTGRSVGDGIYVLASDYSDPLAQGSTPLTAGITTFTNSNSTDDSFSPWRLEVGQDNNLYIADYSETNGTIYVTDPNVATGTNLIAGLGGPDSATASTNHGSIGSSVIALGSLGGGDLVVYAIDTDMTNTTTSGGNHILKWDIGSLTPPVDLTVTNVDNRTLLPNAGITMDLARGPDGKFYTLQNRFDGFEAGLFVVDPTVDGGAFNPGPDGLWDTVYSSFADSFVLGEPTDILVRSRAVAVSPDGRFVAVAKDTSETWVIPLVNGLPILGERKLVPSGSITIGRDIAFDAAGNIYLATSGHAALRVFSPGYFSIATTSSDGSFSVTNIVPETSITLSASNPFASEPSTSGQFTFTRSGGDLSQPLTVSYLIGGTATRGADYNTNAISGTTTGLVSFAAFSTTADVIIPVIDDAIGEPTETVTFQVLPGTNYASVNVYPVTVNIQDDGDLPIASIASRGLGSSELLAGRPAKFRLTLSTPQVTDTTIQVQLQGTAISGSDYVNSSNLSFTIPANETVTNFTVTPIDNSVIAPNKLIIASIQTNVTYKIGTTNATNILRNDDLPPTTTLFSESFDVDPTANWTVKIFNSDNFADLFFDYSTVGIPSAPNSTGGTTRGVRMKAHTNTLSTSSGVSIAPTGLLLPREYRLRFDMWLNFSGPLNGTGSGTTELFLAGVGASETNLNTPFGSPKTAVYFATTGDGGSGTDYRALTNASTLANGAVVTAFAPSGSRDSGDSYYAEFGGQTATPQQLSVFPGQIGVTTDGFMGMAWHDVLITKTSSNVTWTVDGLPMLAMNIANLTSVMASNFFVGYYDPFTGSIATPGEPTFALVDNIRVELLAPQAPVITSITLINAGLDVQVDFTGHPADAPGLFTLQSAGTITTPFADVSATITSIGSGQFRAVRPAAGSLQFYRIKR